MAQAQWTAILISIILIVDGRSTAAAPPEQPVSVTLIDKTEVPPALLERAISEANVIFAAAGVRLDWTVAIQPRLPASPSGRTVMLMIVANHDPLTTRGDCIFGRAVAALSSGYVFYNRIVDAADQRPLDVAVVLGRVMAHELGHVLLPGSGHSSYGIMRGELDLGFTNPDRFTPEEVRRLRALLGAPGPQH